VFKSLWWVFKSLLWVVVLLLSSADFIRACMQEACYCCCSKFRLNPPRSHRSGLWTKVSRLGNTQNTHTHTHTQNLLTRTFILCLSGLFYKSCGSRKISQLQLNCQQNQSKTGRGMNYIISESKAFVFQAKNSSCLKDGVWWGSRPGGSSLQQG
jgi:hypothetical protein